MVLPLPLLLTPFFLLLSGATSNPITVKCTGAAYAPNTPYQTNLNTLLSTLVSESSFTNFNNATVGIGTDRIYGLFLCEGDLAHIECQTYVQSATSSITAPESCPTSRQAIIWYDYCMVRYSDTNFFGVVDSNGFNMTNPDPSQFTNSPVPYEMVANLVQVAPLKRPMFASNASTSIDLYAMAECTDDLTSAGCSQCLKAILGNIKRCCTHSNGWRYLSPSCWIRVRSQSRIDGTHTENIIVDEDTIDTDDIIQEDHQPVPGPVSPTDELDHCFDDVYSCAEPLEDYEEDEDEDESEDDDDNDDEDDDEDDGEDDDEDDDEDDSKDEDESEDEDDE